MTKLRHYDHTGTARFVTFSCYRHLPGLQSNGTTALFMRHLDAAREKYQFQLLGYVVMPDHVHLVLYRPIGEGTR